MRCSKCDGRMFLDRTFTENRNFEVFCIICGARKFISKGSKFGKWLTEQEVKRENAANR